MSTNMNIHRELLVDTFRSWLLREDLLDDFYKNGGYIEALTLNCFGWANTQEGHEFWATAEREWVNFRNANDLNHDVS